MCWALNINIFNLSEQLCKVEIIIPILQMRSVRLIEVKRRKSDGQDLNRHPDVVEGEHGLAPTQCYCSLCLVILLLSTTAMPRSASCLSNPETKVPTPLLLKKEDTVWRRYLQLKTSLPEEQIIQEAKGYIPECLVILERWLQIKSAGSGVNIPEFKSWPGHLTHCVNLHKLLDCSVSQFARQ